MTGTLENGAPATPGVGTPGLETRLTLELLGRYLALARGGHPFRVIEAYERWLEPEEAEQEGTGKGEVEEFEQERTEEGEAGGFGQEETGEGEAEELEQERTAKGEVEELEQERTEGTEVETLSASSVFSCSKNLAVLRLLGLFDRPADPG